MMMFVCLLAFQLARCFARLAVLVVLEGRLKGIRGEQTAGRLGYLDILKGRGQEEEDREPISSPFMF